MFENGKTPDNDGIPVEFYKIMWENLADQLVEVFNYSFQLEEMTTSQRQAIMTLIDRKGTVTTVKTFLIPKLLYVSSIIETPTDVIKKMERMIFKCLWKGPDKVTRLSVMNSVENGGLSLTDLETQIKSIRLSRVPRILDRSREGPWKSYFKHFLKRYGGTFLLKCNYEFKDLNVSLNDFYSELLLWWESLGTHLLISTMHKNYLEQ